MPTQISQYQFDGQINVHWYKPLGSQIVSRLGARCLYQRTFIHDNDTGKLSAGAEVVRVSIEQLTKTAFEGNQP